MKERIVNDYGVEIKSICRGCAEGVKQKCKQTQKEHLQCVLNYSERKDFKVEQVPETFADLKKLCKDIKGIEFAGGTAKGEIIELDNIWFAENGDIWGYTDNWEEVCVIGKDRTPAQMWAIIKNLIGIGEDNGNRNNL